MTPRSTLKVKVIGQRSRSPGLKSFRVLYCPMSNVVMVKGHMGQRQMLIGSRSKVVWIKVSLGIVIFAGGLTSTSSCIFLVIF